MRLHQDIKESINNHFGFLIELGFCEFKEEQRAHEIHVCCRRDHIKIDIEYELLYSTPIWITINNVHLEYLETENQVIKKIGLQKSELYNANFNSYLTEDDTKYLDKNRKLYDKFGKLLNDGLIGEFATILKRNQKILSGDLTALKEAKNERLKIQAAEKLAYLKASKIYICQYTVDDGLVCEIEGSLKEIEKQLNSAKESWDSKVSNIEIVDWDGNIVERKN